MILCAIVVNYIIGCINFSCKGSWELIPIISLSGNDPLNLYLIFVAGGNNYDIIDLCPA